MTTHGIINFKDRWRAFAGDTDLQFQFEEKGIWKTVCRSSDYLKQDSIFRSFFKGHTDDGTYYFISPGPIPTCVEVEKDKLMFYFMEPNGTYRPHFYISPLVGK